MAELSGAGAAGSERLARLVLDVLMAMAVPERFLNDWPVLEATRRGTPQQLPVLAWLNELADGPSPILALLLKEISRAAPELEWRQTYKAEDFGPEFLTRYGWTELIGHRGPIASTKIACGTARNCFIRPMPMRQKKYTCALAVLQLGCGAMNRSEASQ